MKTIMVGLAGPSGSGKSTIARRAQREWPDMELVKLDKFFKDADGFPMSGKWRNWEVPENIRWDELYHALTELKAGREVEVPTYSKPEGRRTGMRVARPARLVLVEGFVLFGEQRIREVFDLKIYLQLASTEQLRRREMREVGFDREYFEQVMVPAFAQYGSAAEQQADAVVDGGREAEAVWQEFRNLVGGLMNGA